MRGKPGCILGNLVAIENHISKRRQGVEKTCTTNPKRHFGCILASAPLPLQKKHPHSLILIRQRFALLRFSFSHRCFDVAPFFFKKLSGRVVNLIYSFWFFAGGWAFHLQGWRHFFQTILSQFCVLLIDVLSFFCTCDWRGSAPNAFLIMWKNK